MNSIKLTYYLFLLIFLGPQAIGICSGYEFREHTVREYDNVMETVVLNDYRDVPFYLNGSAKGTRNWLQDFLKHEIGAFSVRLSTRKNCFEDKKNFNPLLTITIIDQDEKISGIRVDVKNNIGVNINLETKKMIKTIDYLYTPINTYGEIGKKKKKPLEKILNKEFDSLVQLIDNLHDEKIIDKSKVADETRYQEFLVWLENNNAESRAWYESEDFKQQLFELEIKDGLRKLEIAKDTNSDYLIDLRKRINELKAEYHNPVSIKDKLDLIIDIFALERQEEKLLKELQLDLSKWYKGNYRSKLLDTRPYYKKERYT